MLGQVRSGYFLLNHVVSLGQVRSGYIGLGLVNRD
jgi:hypothetical protein